MKRVRVDGELGDVVTDLKLDDADVTAQRLLDTDSNKRVKSTNASSYISGTANQITVTPSNGGVLLSLPADVITTPASIAGWSLGNEDGTQNVAFNCTSLVSSLYLTNPTTAQVQADAKNGLDIVSAKGGVKLEATLGDVTLNSVTGYLRLQNGGSGHITQSSATTDIGNTHVNLTSGSDLVLQASATDKVLLKCGNNTIVDANATTSTFTSPIVTINGTSGQVALQRAGANILNVDTAGVGVKNYNAIERDLDVNPGTTTNSVVRIGKWAAASGDTSGWAFFGQNCYNDRTDTRYLNSHDTLGYAGLQLGYGGLSVFGKEEKTTKDSSVGTIPRYHISTTGQNVILNSGSTGSVTAQVGGTTMCSVSAGNAYLSCGSGSGNQIQFAHGGTVKMYLGQHNLDARQFYNIIIPLWAATQGTFEIDYVNGSMYYNWTDKKLYIYDNGWRTIQTV